MKNKLFSFRLISIKQRDLFVALFILMGFFLFPNMALMSPITTDKIIELTNTERAKLDLSPLTYDQQLSNAAKDKAHAIFKSQVFEHTIGNKKFSNWIKESGYAYMYTGENLAINFITSEGVTKAWLNSPDHRENLLNPKYKNIGVAAVKGIFDGEATIVVVQTFGTPLYPIEKIQPMDFDPNSYLRSNHNIYSEDLLLTNAVSGRLLTDTGNANMNTSPKLKGSDQNGILNEFNISADLLAENIYLYSNFFQVLIIVVFTLFYFILIKNINHIKL